MKIKWWIFLSPLMLIFIYCSGARQLLYQHNLPHQIKWIAVQLPDSTTIPGRISADYLQKMLAYMLYQEKPYFVQPLDSTNQKLNQINPASYSPIELAQILGVDGLLRYDFFDFYYNDQQQVKGFIFSISLLDCQQGRVVWRSVREYRGGENRKSLQALKQYMQTKVKEKSYLPFFAELYQTLKAALQSLDRPDFTDEELSERLMNTTDPF